MESIICWFTLFALTKDGVTKENDHHLLLSTLIVYRDDNFFPLHHYNIDTLEFCCSKVGEAKYNMNIVSRVYLKCFVWSVSRFFSFQICSLRFVVDILCLSLKSDTDNTIKWEMLVKPNHTQHLLEGVTCA